VPAPSSMSGMRAALGLGRRDAVDAVVIVVGVIFVLFALPSLLSPYWVVNVTIALIYAVVALGLGLLAGRVGLIFTRPGRRARARRMDRGAAPVRHLRCPTRRDHRRRPDPRWLMGTDESGSPRCA